MKTTKRILSILISCLMLLGMLSVGVFAEGTQDNPIDAATKWFGFGVNTYLLNPSIAEGSDGMWYTLTAEKDGILALEHKYKDVDYTITISANGKEYVGGSIDGVIYNGPIMTLPLKTGDVATIAIVTKDAAAGTVYASMNIFAGDVDDTIKVKSEGIVVPVGAGETVYFQDDSLQASYATKGLLVKGDVANTTFYAVTKNSESGAASKKAYTDSDADGIIEATLGGSVGGAGAPAVKPAWAIENNSAVDQTYTLTIVGYAHECTYDNDADMDCNICGDDREIAAPCEHAYDDMYDADCNLCGEIRDVPTKPACQHVYDHAFDGSCNLCGEEREALDLPLNIAGSSISEDVNGLAWVVETTVEGVEMKKNHEAIYDNATVGGYKLIKMGAVVSNTGEEVDLDDVNNNNVLNIEAKYLHDAINEENDAATYAIRVINIPEEYKDREIDILTYIIFEDEAGVQHTLYCNSATNTYNDFV